MEKEIIILREFFLSQLLGRSIIDGTGRLVGRLRDMAVRWDSHYPRVTGIKFAKGVQAHIDINRIGQWGEDQIRMDAPFSEEDLHPLTADEIYVGKWLLDKQIIDLKGSKLVRVNDIQLAWVGSSASRDLVLVAVDVGLRGFLRRLGLEFLAHRRPHSLVDWRYIQPLATRAESLRLTMERPALEDLHPADLADIIEDLDAASQNQLLARLDHQTVAEALAEAERDTQVKILTDMDSRRAAQLLAAMPPDEAADILSELLPESSRELLGLMQGEEAANVSKLMKYPENTAGALMTTEFIALPAQMTAQAAINRLRELAPSAETIYYVYVTDAEQVLQGVLSLRDLIVAPPETQLGAIMHRRVISVSDQDNYHQVQETVKKYNLLALPVIDQAGMLVGIITVDDVLETVAPGRGSLQNFTDFMTPGRSEWRWK